MGQYGSCSAMTFSMASRSGSEASLIAARWRLKLDLRSSIYLILWAPVT